MPCRAHLGKGCVDLGVVVATRDLEGLQMSAQSLLPTTAALALLILGARLGLRRLFPGPPAAPHRSSARHGPAARASRRYPATKNAARADQPGREPGVTSLALRISAPSALEPAHHAHCSATRNTHKKHSLQHCAFAWRRWQSPSTVDSSA